jgi:hypothetical protein
LRDAIDPDISHANTLTACFLHRSKVPIAFATDRECMDAGLATCWQPDRTAVRLAIVPNTLEVGEMWVSKAMIGEVERHPHLELCGESRPLSFDSAGNLRQEILFPHCIRARRTSR